MSDYLTPIFYLADKREDWKCSTAYWKYNSSTIVINFTYEGLYEYGFII